MDRKAARIHPQASMALAAELLVLTQASDLAVIDDEGRFVGVLSEGDLLRALMPDMSDGPERPPSLRQAFADFLDAGPAYADQPISRLVIRQPRCRDGRCVTVSARAIAAPSPRRQTPRAIFAMSDPCRFR